jgi:hypothetical protein
MVKLYIHLTGVRAVTCCDHVCLKGGPTVVGD